MSHHQPRQLLGSLKKLLLCSRRRKSGARQSPTSSTESSRQVFGSGSVPGSASGGSEACTDTPDWEQRCPPRPILGLAAKRYRRGWQRQSVSTEYRRLEPQEDTDSVRTLASGSVEIDDTEALIESLATPGLKPEIGDYDDGGAAAVAKIDKEAAAGGCGLVGPEPEGAEAESGCLASNIRRGSFGGCRAEICLLENCDHCSKVKSSGSSEAYVLAKPDDLVVTEYRVETCLTSNKKQSKIINNTLVNFQRQMKAELCEVNLPVEGSLHVRSTDAIHTSTNISNVALPCCSEANHDTACQQHHQPLTVRAQSDESEPRNTCATVTASGQVSSCELADFNDTNNRPTYASATTATEAITNSAGATAHCPWRSRASHYGEAETKPAGMQSQQHRRQQQQWQRSTFDGAVAVEQTNSSFRQPDHLSRERFGTLTGDQCSRLCQGLKSDCLLLQYLAKRDISQTTREWHRQRCGRINEKLMHRILRSTLAADGASSSAAGPAANQVAATAGVSAVASSGDAAAPAAAANASAAPVCRRATVPAVTTAKSPAMSATTLDRQQCGYHDSNSQHHRRRAHISACTWSLHGLP